ncbi:2480_t:CDS:2 [Ambispora gerdemannii]|uniref:2480_t:CDS:1 n=1 Tax=Ambispora gerdemannii TaxID=144530 RepID=A0A9N9DD05_9GLOM|nr:2480_t:CDS:2 [Ambispora gerdemannii]
MSFHAYLRKVQIYSTSRGTRFLHLDQKLGYLYRWHEPNPDVPLDIKAVVAVIYEPPQEHQTDGLSLNLP